MRTRTTAGKTTGVWGRRSPSLDQLEDADDDRLVPGEVDGLRGRFLSGGPGFLNGGPGFLSGGPGLLSPAAAGAVSATVVAGLRRDNFVVVNVTLFNS